MAPSAEPDVLVDTSAAVALIVEDHRFHAVARAALAHRRRGLAGHAVFETYSTVTRMPLLSRMTARAAGDALQRNFPETRYLDPAATAALLASLPQLGIAGGAVYDALVGAAAKVHDLPLVTLDRRAAETYRLLQVDVELLAP